MLHFHSFLFARDLLSLYVIFTQIVSNREYIPPKSALRRRRKRREKFQWRDNRNFRFRITTVTRAIDTEFYVSQCQHVRHPSWDQFLGIFSKSRLQFTRRLIEFRTRTHAHSILPLCGRPCGTRGYIIQSPPADSTLSPTHYYHTFNRYRSVNIKYQCVY